jgi:glycosyltransferase involved in cell wall biosynthesis
MELDVIIPTYNREHLLRRTLDSLLAANVPDGLKVRVTVVDNNSRDETRKTVDNYARRFDGRLDYVFEGRQGRSFALNAGIASTSGDLIGMIDDDEEIDSRWYASINSVFSHSWVDFIGGPYVPRWGARRPNWLPMNYLGAIGWIDGGPKVVPFDRTSPGILMGGNAVLTRAILNGVGFYDTRLGRSGTRLLAGEDEDMYQRLLAAGARGFYIPDLIIYHYIPPERLTKRYFRSWCFWRGVSAGLIDRDRRMPVAYLGGIPRYLYRDLMRGLWTVFAGLFGRNEDPSQLFSNELGAWNAAGFFYGKHLYRTVGSEHSGTAAIPSLRQIQPSALREHDTRQYSRSAD